MKDLIKIEGKEWFLAVMRNMSFWHQWLLTEGIYNKMEDFGIEAKVEHLSVTFNSTQSFAFLNKESYDKFVDKLNDAFKTKEKVEELKKKYIKFGDELQKSLEVCDKELNVKNLDDFQNKYGKYTCGLMITTIFGRTGNELLVNKLKELGFNESEIPNIIGTITYPSEHTPLFNSQLDLLKIGTLIQEEKIKEPDIEIELQTWLKKYGNIPVNYCDEPWTMTDAKGQLETVLKKDCKNEITTLKSSHEQRLERARQILADINNDEVSTLAFALSEGTYLNEYRKNIFSKVSLGYRNIFKKIAEMTGSSNWRDFFYLKPSEMIGILEGEKLNINEIINERKIIGIVIDNGETKVLNTKDTEYLAQYIQNMHSGKKESKIDEQITEVKGFSASLGKVKGTVKVLLSSKDFPKLNIGDILVTTMTSVDFIPVMEKAAAFVTNEGGITSHASIVAREMNKPCVIGTKNATQVFRDGDMVEVDADKGIVRVIK